MRDLRVTFSLILAVALLPSLIFTVWNSLRDFRVDQAARQYNVVQSTRALETEVGETINTAKSLLRSLTTRPVASPCDLDLHAVLEEFGRYDQLAVLSGDGRVLCAANAQTADGFALDASTFTPDNPFQTYSLHKEQGTREVDREGKSFLVIAHAVYSGDKIETIYLLASDSVRLKALKTDILSSGGTRAAIVNRAGTVLIDNAQMFDAFEADWMTAKQDGEILEREIMTQSGDMKALYVLATRAPDIFIAVSQNRESWAQRTLIKPLSSLFIPIAGWLFAFIAIWMATDRLFLSHLKRLGEVALDFADGRFDRRVGDLNDAPPQIRELGSTFDIMADRVSSRDAALQKSLDEKEILLREIHHRVKNNLQIIISLLNIQKRELKDPVYNEAIDETRNRVNAIALVHKALYESDNIEDVPMRPFLRQLIRHASRTLGVEKKNISVRSYIDLDHRTGDRAISVALFIMEAMTNAVKHGVPEGGLVFVKAYDDGDKTIISVTDSGLGPSAENTQTQTGTGSRLMHGFARQLSGTFSTETNEAGYECRLSFPKTI